VNREVHVVCRPELATGMRLVGLPVHPAADADAARAIVASLRDRAGVVLLDDRLRGDAPPAGLPLVVPFPGPTAGAAGDGHVLELLRRAIGYRVRLR
jgi:vacuolar-type H+-ATPase subunit F/Vma7